MAKSRKLKNKKISKKKKVKSKKESKEQKVQKELNELNKLFVTMSFYPVAVDGTKKEEARAQIIKKYKSGKDYMQQNILHLIYENLTQYTELKSAMNYGFFKSKNPEESPAKLKLSVYKSMFNYYSSLEGSLDLISLLGELGDLPSAKLLTHLFNYYSGRESERFKTLRNAVIDALGSCTSTYALGSLLLYAKNVESERLFQRVIESLVAWEDKLGSLPISPEERMKLKRGLEEFLSIVKSEGHSGYVR